MAVEKRESVTSFALTATEKFNLKYMAEKKGVRLSDYIRECVLRQMKKDSK